ncbi:MAG: flagellar biosynthesis regulator FlaF [Alphaproteobacteria bacterium]
MSTKSNGNGSVERLEEDAFALTQAALAISEAKAKGDGPALTQALDDNLKLWVAIRTMVDTNQSALPPEVAANLLRLSKYTAQKTFELENGITDEVLDSLINTNLQISEGLLEGRSRLLSK